jgi:hypothetical protein
MKGIEAQSKKFTLKWITCKEPGILQIKSVPLGGFLEVNLDDLMRIRDVVPATVGLPTIGNNLNESPTERRIGNMGDAFAIGFDVQFYFLILSEGSLLYVLHIDAGILNGCRRFAATHLDRQPRGLGSLGRRLRRRRILRRKSKSRDERESKEKSSRPKPKIFHVSVDSILNDKRGCRQVTLPWCEMQMSIGVLLGVEGRTGQRDVIQATVGRGAFDSLDWLL